MRRPSAPYREFPDLRYLHLSEQARITAADWQYIAAAFEMNVRCFVESARDMTNGTEARGGQDNAFARTGGAASLRHVNDASSPFGCDTFGAI